MYSGVIKNRHIYSLNRNNMCIGNKVFYICNKYFIPPLFVYNDTHYDECFFVNLRGIFVIPKSSIFKLETITKIYNLFQQNAFHKKFPDTETKTNIALQLLSFNNVHIRFVDFENVKYNSKNIEYYTNLSKDAIVLFQTLNSILP